ncbi:aminoglycoside phosphotransferase [Streptomyces sp. NPDC002845]
MATARIPFEDLPAPLLALIEERTGPVKAIDNVRDGFNSEISACLTTASGVCYVKGLRSTHPRVWTQKREAEINPYVSGRVAPRLFWRIEAEGWDLIAFDVLNGHHADYRPHSTDLRLVAETLTRLSAIRAPEGITLKRAEDRLKNYVATPADLEYFAGDALAHTDLNDTNVIVGDQARLVDWAWATRGADWLDAAYWVIWLVAAGGQSPECAEQWADRIPAFRSAPPVGVTAFAEANENLWEEIADADPDPWTVRMRLAASSWAAHRAAV